MENQKSLLTVKEAALALRVSTKTVLRMIANDTICGAFKPGGASNSGYRIPRESIEAIKAGKKK